MTFHDLNSCRLGALVYADGDTSQKILYDIIDMLRNDGVRLGGVAQYSEVVPGQRRKGMILEDLASGRRIRISEYRGNGASGCRLDRSALATASELIRAALNAGLDLVVINKFGVTEAEGRGLVPVIAEAVSSGVPVLIAVPQQKLEAWRAFAGDLACELPLDQSVALRWCRAAVTPSVLKVAS